MKIKRFGVMPNETKSMPCWAWILCHPNGDACVMWDVDHGFRPRIFATRNLAHRWRASFGNEQRRKLLIRKVRIELENTPAHSPE